MISPSRRLTAVVSTMALAGLFLAGALLIGPAVAPAKGVAVPPLPKGQLMGFAVSNERKAVSYLVVDSVKAHDGLVEFTGLTVLSPPKVDGALTIERVVTTNVIDCKANTIQRLSGVLYDPAGVGTIRGSEAKSDAEPPPPRTGLEGLVRTLCRGKAPDPKNLIDADDALQNARTMLAMGSANDRP